MDQDFYVDGIVAEWKFIDGVTRYLIKWEDYPHTDNTWEPEDHLQHDTIADWREEQARIERGDSRAFDVQAWEADVERLQERTEARERRARLKALVEKRARNLDEDDLDDDLENFVDSSNRSQSDLSEDEYIPLYKPRKRRLIVNDDEDDALSPTSPRQKRRMQERDMQPARVNKSPTEGNGQTTAPVADMSLPVGYSDRTPLDAQPGPGSAHQPTSTATRDPADAQSSEKIGVVNIADIARQLKPARKAVNGAGPKRHLLHVPNPSNVFNDWTATVQNRKQNTMPKAFKNASHAWNVGKAGRNEPAPDIRTLELIAPRDGSVIKPVHTAPKNSSLAIISRTDALDEGDNLFLSQSPHPPELTGSYLRRRASQNDDDADFRTTIAEARGPADSTHKTLPARSTRQPNDTKRGVPTAAVTTNSTIAQESVHGFAKARSARPFVAVADWGPHTRHFDDIAKDIDLGAKQLYGSLVVGATDPMAVNTIFRNVPSPWWNIFLKIKPHPKDRDCFVRITQLCTAQGFLRDYHYDGQGYYAAGQIPSWPINIISAKFQAFLSLLRDPSKQYGGLFFSEHYTLLAYATGSPSWKFVERLFPPESPPSALRFVMRAPVPAKKPEITTEPAFLIAPPPLPSKPSNPPLPPSNPPLPPSNPLSPTKIVLTRRSTVTDVNEVFDRILTMTDVEERDRLFRDTLGFDWKTLVPVNRPNGEMPVLFLYYDKNVPQAQGDMFFLRYFFQNLLQMIVYDSNHPGEWSLFSSPANITSGVALFHTSISHFENIKDLAKVLNSASYHLWRIQLGVKPKTSTLQRIFPAGGALLLPDSLILRKPEAVARILQWYRLSKAPKMQVSKWRIVMRTRVRKWIQDIITNQGSYKRGRDELAPYQKILEQLMLAFPLGTTYDAATELERPSPGAALVDPGPLDQYDESLGIAAQDLRTSKQNDDLLVRWFGKWSLQGIDEHRKFHIIFDGHGEGSEADKKCGDRWSSDLRHVTVFRSSHFAQLVMQKDEANYEARVTKQG